MECFSKEELHELFGRVGENVQVDKSVHLVSPKNITIGSNVRIDSWSFLSANKGIEIGNHVHIAHGAYLFGGGGTITIGDFCGVSLRASLFTSTDDFIDGWMTGPTVPDEYRKVKNEPIVMGKHAVVGAGAVVMPGVSLGTGCMVGAMSLVNMSVPDYAVVVGSPAKVMRWRNRERLMKLEKMFHAESRHSVSSIIEELIDLDISMWEAQDKIYQVRRMSFDEYERAYFGRKDGARKLWKLIGEACDLNLSRNRAIDRLDQELVGLFGG